MNLAAAADGDQPEPIAIVGMGCRFPGGVASPADLAALMAQGRRIVSDVPADRWADHAVAHPADAELLRGAVRRGAFLDDVAGFDAEFFGILPREAELMDPQQRVLLEVTWQALEHAGIPAGRLAGTDVGVYVGAVSDDYGRRLLEDLPQIEAWTGICTQMCGLSNRISHALDLRGASLTVDTACSASLVALHQATAALRRGESRVALVGGVNLIVGPGLTLMLDAAGALSPDGVCKSFDASADGYGRGEGAAVLVLKRLSDAVADGDTVHAVVRGSALHQDGRTAGIMAPSVDAQTELLTRAYAAAGVEPRSVGYVEAHGTGTPVGDPMEAAALGAVLGTGRPIDAPLLIGSGKANIGHLEGAAGIAGVIKAVLALTSGVIPATPGVSTPTPAVDWAASRLHVVTEATPWPAGDGPRIAGVSGYGYGGALAHVVLEQAPAVVAAGPDAVPPGPVVVPLSGRTAVGLRANAAALAAHLDAARPGVRTTDTAHLAAIGRTLGSGRTHLEHRAAIVAADTAELSTALHAVARGDEPAGSTVGVATHHGRGPVFVFSGHGAQWAGMGRDLLRTEPEFARVVDEVGDVFRTELGVDPRVTLERADELVDVAVIQSMTFVVQVALDAVWRSLGVLPSAVIGHSVGEIAAAVGAGVLTVRDGARLACRRSALLRRIAGAGAMLLVDLPYAEVETLLQGRADVVAAISAAPGSAVVSGTPTAVEALSAEWEAAGRVVRRVDSDVAFHSPQLDPLVGPMLAAVRDIPHATATVPLYRTGIGPCTGVASPRSIPADPATYWAHQLRAPVRFADAVAAAAEDGHLAFVEISGHPIVGHSLGDALYAAGAHGAVVTGSLRRGADGRRSLLGALGALHAHGVDVDLAGRFGPGERADLPTTAWQHRRFWRAARAGAATEQARHDVASHTLLGARTTVVGPQLLRLWQTRLDFASRPYPGSHPVHGVEIVPAAVLLSTCLAAAASAGADGIGSMALRSPISLARTSQIQVSLLGDELRLASRPVSGTDASEPDDDDAWLTHTTASVHRGVAGATAPLDIPGIWSRCTEVLPATHVADLLAGLDVPAMGYPWAVRRASLRAGAELVAVVTADPGGRDATASWASLLDAALSLPTAVFPGDPVLRMPAEVGSVLVHADPVAEAVVHVRLAAGRTEVVDVLIADHTGRVLVELLGARFGVPDGARPEPADTTATVLPVPGWAGLDGPARLERLVAAVAAQVADEVRLPVDELNVRKPLLELGIDSVMSMAVRRRLERLFGVPLPATLTWNHPTVTAVAAYVEQLLAAADSDELGAAA